MELLGSTELVLQEHFLKGGMLRVAEKRPVSESCVGLRSGQMLVLPGGLAVL